jgi:hypothetical protein
VLLCFLLRVVWFTGNNGQVFFPRKMDSHQICDW